MNVHLMTYQRRQALGHAVRLEPRPTSVAGREELLTGLHARLTARPGLSTVALCGLGGIGKTTVALEYAHRYIDHYQVVWHFHAENATALLAQFHELAQALDAIDPSGSADPVAQVHAALAAHQGPWLIVLDNIRDHATAARWLPAKGNGHTIITTQDGHWPAAQAIEIGTLPLDAATSYLLDRAGDHDITAARAIATELGLLPLALAQAGAFIETTGRSLADYRQLLHTDRAQVLTRGAPTAHSTPVAATWSLALRDLAETSPTSVTLLRLLACLAPEEIPFRLILATPTRLPDTVDTTIVGRIASLHAGSFALDDAVAGLRRHSLIGPPSNTVTVHRLVQAITLDQLDPAQRQGWRDAAAALIENAIPADPQKRAAWPACALLLPHALTVLDPVGQPMWDLAGYLGAAGAYTTAHTVWQGLTDAHAATLGPEHPDTFNARAQLAYWTGQSGNAAMARDLYRELLPIYEKVSGPEHTDTLNIRANVAYWTGQAGDGVEARDLYRELMPIFQKMSGAEHPHTLNARANVAYWTGQAGDAVEARELYLQLLPIYERVSGPEHPDTLNIRTNVARWTGQAGDAVAARDLCRELLPIREMVSGPEHPGTLTDRANLAYWTGQAGDAVAARDIYRQLLPIQERVSGPDHPDTVNARANLEYWTRQAG